MGALYPKFKEQLLQSQIDSLLYGSVKVMLIKNGYVYNEYDRYVADISAYDGGRSGLLQNKSVWNGVFDADNIGVSVTSGGQIVALVLYIDKGDDNLSPLIAYLDSVGGLPTMCVVNDIVYIIWDDGLYKIFSL
jgi:hypothetical protein